MTKFRFYQMVENWLNKIINITEAWLRQVQTNSSFFTEVAVKILLLIATLVITLIPVWTGLAAYHLLIFLASLLGIAVIGLKIAIFLILFICLFKLQSIFALCGMGASLLIVLI